MVIYLCEVYRIRCMKLITLLCDHLLKFLHYINSIFLDLKIKLYSVEISLTEQYQYLPHPAIY